MTGPGMSCCSAAASLGGLNASDFSALDVLALKLACLDGGFAAPLRRIGSVFGERMASGQGARPLSSEAALARMLSACGLPSVLQSRFLLLEERKAQLEITGCAEACCKIPLVGRAVCGFNAGVFEGFLRGVTGEPWAVYESACLGLGHASCEFLMQVERASGAAEEAQHGRH